MWIVYSDVPIAEPIHVNNELFVVRMSRNWSPIYQVKTKFCEVRNKLLNKGLINYAKFDSLSELDILELKSIGFHVEKFPIKLTYDF